MNPLFHYFRRRMRRPLFALVGERIALTPAVRYICLEYSEVVDGYVRPGSWADTLVGDTTFAYKCWTALRPNPRHASVEQACFDSAYRLSESEWAEAHDVRLMLVAMLMALDEAGDLEPLLT